MPVRLRVRAGVVVVVHVHDGALVAVGAVAAVGAVPRGAVVAGTAVTAGTVAGAAVAAVGAMQFLSDAIPHRAKRSEHEAVLLTRRSARRRRARH